MSNTTPPKKITIMKLQQIQHNQKSILQENQSAIKEIFNAALQNYAMKAQDH